MDIKETISDMLVEKLLDVPGWMEKSSCIDTELDAFNTDHVDEFKKLCESCPVLKQCESKFTQFNREVRPLQNGVFHGQLYQEG